MVIRYNTWLAVRKFQENGLKVDGIAGPATLSKIGINTAARTGSSSEKVYSWGLEEKL